VDLVARAVFHDLETSDETTAGEKKEASIGNTFTQNREVTRSKDGLWVGGGLWKRQSKG